MLYTGFLLVFVRQICAVFSCSTKTPLFGLQNVVWCSDMSSIIASVFNATIGWLVNKGRDLTAERLKEGDVADQKIRDLIVRELEDIKSKLDGLSRKDLLVAVDSFKIGIRYLFEAFDEKPSGQASVGITDENLSEHDLEEAMKTVSVAAEIGKFEKMDFNETMKNNFFQAKKRFEMAREKATEASNNEALKIFDRITAIRYRVMATVLESVVETVGATGDMSLSSLKNALKNALPECEECLQKLHSLPAVQDNFKVELDKGVLNVRGRYGKDERRKIISTVCQVNRAIYNAKRAVGRDALVWPFVDTGQDKVDPLRDGRISKVLHKVNMEHCCLLWSFGQEGKEKHRLRSAFGIATNIKGQFLIADSNNWYKAVKVFDSNGKCDFWFNPQTDSDTDTKLHILDVAAGEDEKIYLLVELEKPGVEKWREVQVFNETADRQPNLQHKFPVRSGEWDWVYDRLVIVSSGKQRGKIVLKTKVSTQELNGRLVDIHEPSGEFVCSFEVFKNRIDISATCDGRIMIVDRSYQSVHVFDIEGHKLGKFDIKCERDDYYRIACHPSGEHVVLAGAERGTGRTTLAIYTVNGKFVRKIQLDKASYLTGMTVTVEGHIAVAFDDKDYNGKVTLIVF